MRSPPAPGIVTVSASIPSYWFVSYIVSPPLHPIYPVHPVSTLPDRRSLIAGSEVTAGEGEERRPVRARGVSAAVLAEGHVPVDQRGLDRRGLAAPPFPFGQAAGD